MLDIVLDGFAESVVVTMNKSKCCNAKIITAVSSTSRYKRVRVCSKCRCWVDLNHIKPKPINEKEVKKLAEEVQKFGQGNKQELKSLVMSRKGWLALLTGCCGFIVLNIIGVFFIVKIIGALI